MIRNTQHSSSVCSYRLLLGPISELRESQSLISNQTDTGVVLSSKCKELCFERISCTSMYPLSSKYPRLYQTIKQRFAGLGNLIRVRYWGKFPRLTAKTLLSNIRCVIAFTCDVAYLNEDKR